MALIEVYDSIYQNEENRLDELFSKYKEGQLIDMMREHPNLFVTDKKNMLDKVQSKINDKIKGKDDFEKGVYF
jgi:hypothetical protein